MSAVVITTEPPDESTSAIGLITRLAYRAADAWRFFMIALPYLWLLLFFLIPFAIVLKISFANMMFAQPPFSPMFDWAKDAELSIRLTISNFSF